MAGRDVFIPADFVGALRVHVAGFEAEPERNQWGLALLAWVGSQKRYQHRTDRGKMSFSARMLEELFGRKSATLFQRIDFFQRSASWNHKAGVTRAYLFSAQVRQALDAYAGRSSGAPVDLLSLHGTRMKVAKTLPRAISSKDTNGRTISIGAWGAAMGMNRVPVNTDMLDALRMWSQNCLRDDHVQGELRAFVERLRDLSAKILRMSETTLAGSGHIQQVYSIAPTGRVYARGLNLQNAPALVKEAALDGLWEYDFSNCHFSIFAQMAARFGVDCHAIEHYIQNKARVRQEVAEGAMITVDEAKHCMLSLLYGARLSDWGKSAIPSAIGLEAAGRLYKVPSFQALNAEIDGARRAILAGWTAKSANGSLVNAVGKAIRADHKAAAQLAHLLQGVEAKALMTAVMMRPDDIVLLQHDGFVARRRLDCGEIEQAVFDNVGYRLGVEEQQLRLHAEPRALLNRTKSEMAREALPNMDSESVSAD